jgi:hypothetical protein
LENVSRIINPFFTSCREGGVSPTAGFTDDGIKVSGKGDICILIPYGFFPNDKGNILTNFGFEFSGNARLTSCLFSQETSKCIYYRNPVRNGNAVSFTYALGPSEAGKRAIKIFIQPENTKNNNYELAKLASSYSKSLVDLNVFQNFVSDVFQNTENISFKKIYLPKNIIYDPGFTVTNIENFKSDCQASPSTATKEIVKENGVKSIKYSASFGSFCDHFSYQNLPHNQGYLVVINSKNESGLPLTVCITDYTSRKCDVYSDLTGYKAFDKDVLLLPPMDSEGVGYDVNIENLGIKGSKATNYLSSVEFIPIPYEFLDNINTKEVSANKFLGKVTSFKQTSPLSYIVETSGKPTILAFYRSFEKGFKAYEINCSSPISCLIAEKTAPFIGKEISKHVLVDNWANGWIVNSKRIEIIFVPQYMEALGLLLIGAVFASLLYKLKRQK